MEVRKPEVTRSEVDGIPTFSVDGPRPFTAVLDFRVGVFDERLTHRGITHLVEHLSLYPHRETEISYNGAVGPHLTGFWAQGHPDEVGGFLRSVCQSLHNLELDRLEIEAEVLEREATLRPGSAYEHVLWAYFGPYGPGATGAYEFGLNWLGPDEIEEWAATYFTRGNAALIVVGDPPDSWDLDLPDGDRVPFELPTRHRPTPSSPTLLDNQETGVTWGTMISDTKSEITPGFHLAQEVLIRRLQDRLRHDLGRTYAVNQGWQRLDRDHLFASHGFDADPSQSREVSMEHQKVIGEFLEEGPTREEMERHLRMRIKAYEDHPHDAARHHVGDEAEAYLLDWGPTIDQELWAVEARSMTPEQVRDRFAEAYRQSYTIADLPTGELTPIEHLFSTSEVPQPGVQFSSKPRHRASQPAAMRVGPDGVGLLYDKGWVHTPTDQVAMVSSDGPRLTVEGPTSATIDTSRYVRSLSRWRRPRAVWPASIVLLVAALALMGTPGMSIGAWIVALMAIMLSLAAKRPDPTEILDRSLTIEQALHRYLPEDRFLPKGRSEENR